MTIATAKMKSSANHLAIFTLTHCGEHFVTGALAVGWACTAPAVATDGIFVTYKVGSFKDARIGAQIACAASNTLLPKRGTLRVRLVAPSGSHKSVAWLIIDAHPIYQALSDRQ